jgi:hypothetical protein
LIHFPFIYFILQLINMSYFKVRNPLNEKQTLVSGSGDVLASDILGQSFVSDYSIDDSASASAQNLWSSAKILSSTIAPVSPAVAGDLAKLTLSGSLQDAGVAVDDAAAPSTSVLWTSSKVDSKYQDLVSPAVAGDLATLDALGQTIDSGLKVDDAAAPSTSVLYSSSKNSASFQKFVAPVVAGDLATLDALGQTVDSGLKVDDAAAPSTSVLYSSSKVAALVADKIFVRGNFDVVTIPNVTTVALACTAPQVNIGGGWAGSLFTAPRSGLYTAGFVMQNDGGAGVNALTYWEGSCVKTGGQNFVNVTFFQTPTAAQNVAVSASGAFSMTAGEQLYFNANNRTGFAQTLGAGDYNTFFIAEV